MSLIFDKYRGKVATCLMGVLSLLAISCRTEVVPGTIAWNTSPSSEIFPKPATGNPLPVVHSISDIVTLKQCIKLEATEASLVAEVSSVQFLAPNWYVVDKRQQTVFTFSENGHFLGLLGRNGNGPGEYLDPGGLFLHDDQLVVPDNRRGTLIYYDASGTFLRETFLGGMKIYTLGPYVFHEGKAYIANFSSDLQNVPYHVVLDVKADPWRVLYGFGERFPLLYDAQGKRRPEIRSHEFTAFTRVGDHLWVGPPHRSHVEIYDLEGRHLADLPPGLNGLTEKDFENVTQDHERLRVMLSKFGTHAIWHLEPYVLVLYIQARDKRISIFDEAGRMIQPNLAPHPFLHNISTRVVGNRLVTPLSLSDLTDKGLSRFSAEERAIIDASGFDPENAENDNPYLLISGRKE